MVKQMKIIKGLFPYIAIIIFIIIIRMYIITPVRVDGTSMHQTLNDVDILLLYKMAKYDRFDIVVLNEEYDDEIIIKRIIGLPGETIEIRDGEIYIDEVLMPEDYGYGETSDYDKVTLEDDEYFILGDNRLISKDSRYFGPVKKNDLMGEAVFRLWPFSGFGLID